MSALTRRHHEEAKATFEPDATHATNPDDDAPDQATRNPPSRRRQWSGSQSASDLSPIVELTEGALEPLVRDIARRVVRNGDPRVPGFAILPRTRHVVRTPDAAWRLQLAIMRALVTYLQRQRSTALRPQRYVALRGSAARRHYARAELFVDDRWKVFHGVRTARTGGGEYHFDDLRTIVSSLCYRERTNVEGGTLQFLDLLAFARDRGFRMAQLFSYHLLAIGLGGGYTDDHRCPHQLCALVHPRIVTAAADYRIPVELDHAAWPIVIFTNRTSDGLIHTATSVRRADPRKPCERPFTYANIFHADPWQLEAT